MILVNGERVGRLRASSGTALCKKDTNLSKYGHLIEEARGVLCNL